MFWWRRFLWVLVGSLTWGGGAFAASYIFKWADTQGNLHVTDRLDDVPEPYRSLYAAKIRKLEQQEAGKTAIIRPQPSATTPTAAPRGPRMSVVEGEIQRRRRWKALVAQWRTELQTATNELGRIERERDQARLNPILRQTPAVQAKLRDIEEKRRKILARVNRARKVLLEEIPAKARRDRVPPKWLE